MSPNVEVLARDLGHADSALRLAAATALAHHADAALAVEPLVHCLRDADAAVRAAAVTALKHIAHLRRERVEAAPQGISPGQVALKGAQSIGCLLQLVLGLAALTALVLKLLLAFK